MSALETILAFLTVMGVLAIPLAALITRRNSAIGQALGDRIRRRTALRHEASDLLAAGRNARGKTSIHRRPRVTLTGRGARSYTEIPFRDVA